MLKIVQNIKFAVLYENYIQHEILNVPGMTKLSESNFHE